MQKERKINEWKIRSRRFHTKIFAKSRLLETTKWSSNIRLVVAVDEAGSSIQLLTDIHGLVDVVCEDAGGETELSAISTLQHTINVTVG